MKRRILLVSTVSIVLTVGCQESPPTSPQLAADQILRLPMYYEPNAGGGGQRSLDPATLQDPVVTSVGDNLFDGLYRYDEHMQEVPDIAKGPPSVSGDGLTYTFRLRNDVRFWNGDQVTAADVIYSWNRAAQTQGVLASIFQPLAGYDAVASGNSGATLALSSPDPYTLVARLSQPTGYWVEELALSAGWVVDQRAIADGGQNRWWTIPQDTVGTGPFRLTNWTPGAELDFVPVEGWWGGSTGPLKRVELHITSRDNVWSGYRQGRYDMVGYGDQSNAVNEAAEIDGIRADAHRASEIHSWPLGSTSWVAFNLQSGPFAGDGTGMQLRRAFSEAIDRKKLADAICHGGTVCVPATGGLISKGLVGYLGDGADPAQFNAGAARALVKRADPNGSLLRGLVLYFPTPALDPAQALADNLTAQWRANLGIDVAAAGLDRGTFFPEEGFGKFTLWRLGWLADFDHPQDWLSNLFVNAPGCGRPVCDPAGQAFDRPGFTDLMAAADKMALHDALPEYRQAEKMLLDDYAIAVLYYLVRTVVIKPYVQGYWANLLWESRWTSMSILEH